MSLATEHDPRPAPSARPFQEEAGHLPHCVSAAALASEVHLSIELANAPEEGARGRKKMGEENDEKRVASRLCSPSRTVS